MLNKFRGKKALTNVAISLARDNLPGLLSNLTSSAINKFDRNISGKGAVRTGKAFPLFISNEDMNDIIKIIKSLQDLCVAIDGVTDTVKHNLNAISWALLTSGWEVRRAGRGYVDKSFYFHSIL